MNYKRLEVVGASHNADFQRMREWLTSPRPSRRTLIITGERGSGKSILTQALQEWAEVWWDGLDAVLVVHDFDTQSRSDLASAAARARSNAQTVRLLLVARGLVPEVVRQQALRTEPDLDRFIGPEGALSIRPRKLKPEEATRLRDQALAEQGYPAETIPLDAEMWPHEALTCAAQAMGYLDYARSLVESEARRLLVLMHAADRLRGRNDLQELAHLTLTLVAGGVADELTPTIKILSEWFTELSRLQIADLEQIARTFNSEHGSALKWPFECTETLITTMFVSNPDLFVDLLRASDRIAEMILAGLAQADIAADHRGLFEGHLKRFAPQSGIVTDVHRRALANVRPARFTMLGMRP